MSSDYFFQRLLVAGISAVLSLGIFSVAKAEIREECRDTAKKYLIHGSLSGVFAGDRLWSLPQIFKDAQILNNSCLSQIKKQGLADARGYWLEYIAVKYGCIKVDKLELANQRPQACPEEKWDLIHKNLSFVDSIENGKFGGKLTAKKAKPSTPNPIEDPCAQYKYSDEHLKPAPIGESKMDWLKDCSIGMGKGFTQLLSGIKEGYKTLAQAATDPQYRAAITGALSDLLYLIKEKPLEVLDKMAGVWVQEFRQYQPELACLNGRGLLLEFCNQATKLGVGFLSFGFIRKVASALKLGMKPGALEGEWLPRATEIQRRSNRPTPDRQKLLLPNPHPANR